MKNNNKKQYLSLILLPATTALPAHAVNLQNAMPYVLSSILLFSFGALLLAHLSILKMRRYQSRLEQSEERLRLSLWGSGDELWDWNIASGSLYRSSSWQHPVELKPETNQFPPNRDQIHPRDIERVTEQLYQHLAGETPYFEAAYRLRASDGGWVWVLDRGKVVSTDAEGVATRMTGTLKNIQLLKQTEERLELFARCLENISDAVVICDTNFIVLEVNHSFSTITGKSREQVIKKPFDLAMYPSRFIQEIGQTLQTTGSWQGEVQDQRISGEVYQAELNFDIVRDDHGVLTQYVAVFSDISERKKREAELSRLANSDTLTGLPNRAMFSAELGRLVDREVKHALLVFDLDNFKKINDSLGHQLGDSLLIKLAERLSQLTRQKERLYRLGGDEFAILLENTNDIHTITTMAKELIKQINLPFFISQHELAITSSIGIVLYPEDGRDPEALLRNADTAMYHAKNDGANRYLFLMTA